MLGSAKPSVYYKGAHCYPTSVRIGIDAGGTFTDFVVLHENGGVDMFKLRSDPQDPAAVIVAGVRRATSTAGPLPSAAGSVEIVHGSTVATNALLERQGARTAFVTTPGFSDLLALGRQNRLLLYALLPPERPNLVPSQLCTEWEGDTGALLSWIRQSGAESVGICLLNAYLDPAAEIAVERAVGPSGLYVCRSSEIAPEFREYERASTTVLNAYVGPLMDRYLANLESGCPFPIQVMQSSGGLLRADEARKHAVRTILSGPAGGIVGSRAMARRAGWNQAITFDMGGTSTDVSLVEEPLRFATESWIENFPVRVPMLDIHTVGAGGGSLASVDAGGRLRVGPESAGSRPGPACYGTGEQATVTDAHVVLGRILPERFLDGSMRIQPDRAYKSVTQIAHALGVSNQEAALAIVRIANSNMERAIRAVSVEKGRDTRDFPLVAFGGCGGLHACEIAEELGIETVIFPPYAGALSALGMLLAARSRDYAAGALSQANHLDLFHALRTRAVAEMPGGTTEQFADIRYRGQSYELTVAWNEADPRQPFEGAYRRIYGFHDPQREIEIVTVRVRVSEPANSEWFENAAVQRIGQERQVIDGGSLLFDYGSTIFIPDSWRAQIHPGGAWVAHRAENLHTLLGGT